MRTKPVIFTGVVVILLSAMGCHPLILVLYSVPGLILSQTLLYRTTGPARNRLWWITLLNLCLHLTVLTTSWPLRLSYALTEPALQRLADDIQRGNHPITYPRQVGLFRITGVDPESYPGTAYFRLALTPNQLQIGVNGVFPPQAGAELILRKDHCRLMPGR